MHLQPRKLFIFPYGLHLCPGTASTYLGQRRRVIPAVTIEQNDAVARAQPQYLHGVLRRSVGQIDFRARPQRGVARQPRYAGHTQVQRKWGLSPRSCQISWLGLTWFMV